MDLGYAPGAWDMFHVGHLAFLRRARRMCDSLVVGVVADEVLFEAKGKYPMFPLEERIAVVEALDIADRVVVDPSRDKRIVWDKVRFDRLFKGDDWVGTPQGERLERAMAEVGVHVYYLPYTERTSSTKLRAQVVELAALPTPKFNILMVCRDNLFHSPIMAALLQERIDSRGLNWTVTSAGLNATSGQLLPTDALASLTRHGIEPSEPGTRALDADLVKSADLILTATVQDRTELISAFPETVTNTFTLKQFGKLVSGTDPKLNLGVDGLMQRAELGRAQGGQLPPDADLSLPHHDEGQMLTVIIDQTTSVVDQIAGKA